jgi:ubiquinol-cytochrome c reductase cytochrome b subunit
MKTILPSYRLLFPRTWNNPLTYLGLLSFACFLILGVSGMALMVYYVPQFAGSYPSVSSIMSDVPLGLQVRNIHYYASDFMVILAMAHFFYLYYVGKYRFRNEVLWLTGMAFGVLAVMEAYTGYVLIMNTRAFLALNIGSGLLNSISPGLSGLLIGGSYNDLVLRVYSLHVLILPVIMVLLVLVHFPRTLTVDIPSIATVSGLILVVGGLLPVELGAKFVPNSAASITVPEWYLTGIYTLLRTGAPVFIAGVFLPFLFLFIFSLIPFYDVGSSARSRSRFLAVAFGSVALSQVALVTVWGFRAGSLFAPLTSEEGLIIDPATFWTTFLLTGAAAFGATWIFYRARSVTVAKAAKHDGRAISSSVGLVLLSTLAVAELALLGYAIGVVASANPEVAMAEVGIAVLLFGLAARVFLMSRPSAPNSNQRAVATAAGEGVE